MIAIALSAWHALSPLGLLLGAGGLGLLAVVFFGLVALPGWLTRPLMVAGAALLVAGLIYQTAYALATHAAELRTVQAIADANRRRAEAAEAAAAADHERAAADAAAVEPLRREIEETPPDAAPALPRAAVRRLRAIQ